MNPSPHPASLPVFAGSSAGPRLELHLSPEASREDGSEPFVPLRAGGPFSRVLLGRVAMGSDTTVQPLAITIQRSAYASPPEGTTNAQVDEAWRAERGRLRALADTRGIHRLLDAGDESARSLPVTYCRKVGKYFHPLCPSCRAPLADCRDDARLRAAGLPAYSESIERFLHCPACAGAGEDASRTFYTYDLGGGSGAGERVTVRRRGELYRDGAAILEADLSPEEASRLESAFPCVTCDHRKECYPASADPDRAIRAESRLLPLSYYEFQWLAQEPSHLRYDEWCDLLGGASWSEVKARATVDATTPGRKHLLDPLDARFASVQRWAHLNDASGRLPVEVLRLRLTAFTQVCRVLREYHEEVGQAHLGLHPGSIFVEAIDAGEDLPVRWGFQAKLTDLAAATEMRPDPGVASLPQPLLRPPADLPGSYRSPFAEASALTEEVSMRISLRDKKREDGGTAFEADAVAGADLEGAWRPGDVARIVPTGDAGGEGEAIWGEIASLRDKGFRISGRVRAGDPGAAAMQGPTQFDARVHLHRRLHVPCDLHGLGRLYFRTLLVSDELDADEAEKAVDGVLAGLEKSLSKTRAHGDESYVLRQLTLQVRGAMGAFDSKGVLYSGADRQGAANAIPRDLWADLMAFGFRLLLTTSAWTYARDHSDYDREHPESTMGRVMHDLDELNGRVHAELFSHSARDLEISQVCEEMISELTGAMPAARPGEPTEAS